MPAYLDSAGNVNTAIASDAQSFVFAIRQAAAIASSAATATLVATAASQLFTTDGVTGMTSAAITDV